MGRYERLPELAAELVRLKVDVLVTYGTPGTRAAKQATTTIPIVMAASGDAAGFAEAGGLIEYGVNFPKLVGRAAHFVDKIFKGAKPENIPVERPTGFDLAINLKTAKALGIKIPNSILLQATKVIE